MGYGLGSGRGIGPEPRIRYASLARFQLLLVNINTVVMGYLPHLSPPLCCIIAL